VQVLECLSEDVEWVLPGFFHTRGKPEFASQIVSEGFEPNPTITADRTIQVGDTIIVEGHVDTKRTDGKAVKLAFCDVFDMKGGKIVKLTSYLMQTSK
jgi:ketosteroid isomerase-like protein